MYIKKSFGGLTVIGSSQGSTCKFIESILIL